MNPNTPVGIPQTEKTYDHIFKEILETFSPPHIVAFLNSTFKHNMPPNSTIEPLRTESNNGDLPMSVPDGMEDYRFAELCVILPPDGPLDMESLKASEDNYWPIRCLKQNAKFPHEYDTYFSTGHTVQGADGETLSPNCPYSGFLIAVPVSLDEEFQVLHLKNGDLIHFYCLIPLYAEELNVKTIYGLDDLFELFERFDVTMSSIFNVRTWPSNRKVDQCTFSTTSNHRYYSI